MSLTTIAKRVRKEGPRRYPILFDCKVEEVFKEQLKEDYSPEALAQAIDVHPATMRNILAGCSVKLENAMALAALAKRSVEELWKLK
jgi:DNA-binding XRE family transcriptional regulator